MSDLTNEIRQALEPAPWARDYLQGLLKQVLAEVGDLEVRIRTQRNTIVRYQVDIQDVRIFREALGREAREVLRLRELLDAHQALLDRLDAVLGAHGAFDQGVKYGRVKWLKKSLELLERLEAEMSTLRKMAKRSSGSLISQVEEQAKTIRELLAERDRLRAALKEPCP